MPYSLLKCRFTTPLHVGSARGGPGLEDCGMIVPSDTLFSALVCEAAAGGTAEELIRWSKEQQLVFSDLLPFCGEQLYVPRPAYAQEKKNADSDASLKKRIKNMPVIPVGDLREYMRGNSGPALGHHRSFGVTSQSQRVAITGLEQPLPYHVGQFTFFSDCGLYTLVKADNREQLERVKALMVSLGATGIGGKRSSGLGKFTVESVPLPDRLKDMLSNRNAGVQLLISTSIPEDRALEQAMDGACTVLLRRGGYIDSPSYADHQVRKKTVFFFASGSCFRRRFAGELAVVGDRGAHPVYRCGRAMFLGVD